MHPPPVILVMVSDRTSQADWQAWPDMSTRRLLFEYSWVLFVGLLRSIEDGLGEHWPFILGGGPCCLVVLRSISLTGNATAAWPVDYSGSVSRSRSQAVV